MTTSEARLAGARGWRRSLLSPSVQSQCAEGRLLHCGVLRTLASSFRLQETHRRAGDPPRGARTQDQQRTASPDSKSFRDWGGSSEARTAWTTRSTRSPTARVVRFVKHPKVVTLRAVFDMELNDRRAPQRRVWQAILRVFTKVMRASLQRIAPKSHSHLCGE